MGENRRDESRINYLRRAVASDHADFIAANPTAALAELRRRLETALDQIQDLLSAHGDIPVRQLPDLPEPLASELAAWQTNEAVQVMLAHRVVGQRDLLEQVAELEAQLGPEFLLAELVAGERAARVGFVRSNGNGRDDGH